MLSQDQIDAIIAQGIAALNAERPAAEAIPFTPDTVLFGVDAVIDSLSLVSLIVDVETALAIDHDLDICLTDDRAMSRAQTPYATIGSLRAYVLELLVEHSAEGA